MSIKYNHQPVRCTPELLEAVRAAADDDERSMSGWVRIAVRRAATELTPDRWIELGTEVKPGSAQISVALTEQVADELRRVSEATGVGIHILLRGAISNRLLETEFDR